MKALRVAALLLTLSGVAGAAVALGGCGGASSVKSPASERLQREDLVSVSRGLRQAQSSVQQEMAAARIAWPLVANGLPASIPAATHEVPLPGSARSSTTTRRSRWASRQPAASPITPPPTPMRSSCHR